MGLESILEDQKHSIELKGEQVEVKTITMGVLPKVIKGAGVVQKFINSGLGDFDLIVERWADITNMVVALTDRDITFIDNLTSYEVIVLLEGIYEVNKKDFLLLKGKMETLDQTTTKTLKKNGQTQSKASSLKATS